MNTTAVLPIAILALALATANAAAQTPYRASLTGGAEVPPNASPGTGDASVLLNATEDLITVDMSWTNLESNVTAAHIHGPAGVGTNAGVIFTLTGMPAATHGSIPQQFFAITPTQVGYLQSGLLYFNIHTTTFPGGEIRGQILYEATADVGLAAHVSWFAAAGFHYQVQAAEAMTTNVWFDLGDPVPGDDAVNAYFDPIGANPHRFYRILTLP
jgi:hypothetical protein